MVLAVNFFRFERKVERRLVGPESIVSRLGDRFDTIEQKMGLVFGTLVEG